MKVIYPGTFDPITNGHLDIIQRAAGLFTTVVVAVARSARKTPMLSLDERVACCRESVVGFANVQVEPFDGLVVDIAQALNANAIIRGLRSVADVDYEFAQAHMNQQMLPTLETLYFAAVGSNSYISGTMVREIQALGGDISAFVPDAVIQRLKD